MEYATMYKLMNLFHIDWRLKVVKRVPTDSIYGAQRLSHKYLFIIGICLFIFSQSTGTARGLTWHQYGMNEYALTSTWSNWQDAEMEAVNVGGHLVTINDAEENAWLTATFADTYNRNGYGLPWQALVWIGYYYDGNINQWKWISGETVTYFNPAPNWPIGGKFAYLHVPPHPWSGTWNDNPSHQDNYGYQPKGIIERVVPEPASILLFGTGLAVLARVRRKLRK